MRQILFRGKRVDNDEWVEGDLSKIHNRVYISQFVLDDTFQDGAENKHLYKHIWVLPETVGQYTGLLDKHGKKIFEGDVVKNSCCVTLRSGDNENKWDCTIMGVVTFRKGGFWVKTSEFDFPVSNEYEVIGNIHDNKLEVEE